MSLEFVRGFFMFLRYEIRKNRRLINERWVREDKKKISWYSRGDYTTGAKDTFACCRSDTAKAISPLE